MSHLDAVALDDFVDRAEEVSRQIEALLHDSGPVKPASEAEAAEAAAERARRRRWDRELAATARREEREKWWTKARLFYNEEQAVTDAGNTGSAASSAPAAAPKGRYSGPESYRKWDSWVPDDPVSIEEEERLRIAKEKAADEAFEKANPGFVAAFMADLEQRKAGDRRKERQAGLHKDRGNAAYKAGDMSTAIKEYAAAVELLPFSVPALNNLAQAHLRRAAAGGGAAASGGSGSTEEALEAYAGVLFDWECALDYADRVVFIAPKEVKALFRRALARAGAWGAVRRPPPALVGSAATTATALTVFPAIQPATKAWVETLLSMSALTQARLAVQDLSAAAGLDAGNAEVKKELERAKIDLAEAAAAAGVEVEIPTPSARSGGSAAAVTPAASAAAAAPAPAAAAAPLPAPLQPLQQALAACDATTTAGLSSASLPATTRCIPRLLLLDTDTCLRPAASALVEGSPAARLALSVAFRTSGLLARLGACVTWTVAVIQELMAATSTAKTGSVCAAATAALTRAGVAFDSFAFLLHPTALEPALLLLSAGACDNARAMRELSSSGSGVVAAAATLVGAPPLPLRRALETGLFHMPTTAVPLSASDFTGSGSSSASSGASSSGSSVVAFRLTALAPLLSAALGLLDLFTSARHTKAASTTMPSPSDTSYVSAPSALAVEAATGRGTLISHPTLLSSPPPPPSASSGPTPSGGGLMGLLAVCLRAALDNLLRGAVASATTASNKGAGDKASTVSPDPDAMETEALDALLAVVKGAADVVTGLAAAAAGGDAALVTALSTAVVTVAPSVAAPPALGSAATPLRGNTTALVPLVLGGLSTVVLIARLYDRPALLTSPVTYALVAAIAGLAEVAQLRPAFTATAPGGTTGSALPCTPLLLLQATPIGSSSSSSSSSTPFAGSGDEAWESIRGTALAALANACLGNESATAALVANTDAVSSLTALVVTSGGVALPPSLAAAFVTPPPSAAASSALSAPLQRLLAAAAGSTCPQPASLAVAGRAAVALGRLVAVPAAATAVSDPAIVSALLACLVSATQTPATAASPHLPTLEDGIVRILAAAFQSKGNAAAAAAYGPAFTTTNPGALPALAALLRRAVATMSTAAAVRAPRVACVGNVCKLVIGLADEEGLRRRLLAAGVVDATVEALKAGAGRDTGAIAAAAGVVKNNAAVALAKLAKDPACMSRIRDTRGLEILTQLGNTLLK